jgi:hypothetical protein
MSTLKATLLLPVCLFMEDWDALDIEGFSDYFVSHPDRVMDPLPTLHYEASVVDGFHPRWEEGVKFAAFRMLTMNLFKFLELYHVTDVRKRRTVTHDFNQVICQLHSLFAIAFNGGLQATPKIYVTYITYTGLSCIFWSRWSSINEPRHNFELSIEPYLLIRTSYPYRELQTGPIAGNTDLECQGTVIYCQEFKDLYLNFMVMYWIYILADPSGDEDYEVLLLRYIELFQLKLYYSHAHTAHLPPQTCARYFTLLDTAFDDLWKTAELLFRAKYVSCPPDLRRRFFASFSECLLVYFFDALGQCLPTVDNDHYLFRFSARLIMLLQELKTLYRSLRFFYYPDETTRPALTLFEQDDAHCLFTTATEQFYSILLPDEDYDSPMPSLFTDTFYHWLRGCAYRGGFYDSDLDFFKEASCLNLELY